MATETEAAGGMSLALEAVRTTICACPTWQAWTGVDAKPAGERMALAKRRTHLFSLPMPAESQYTREELEGMRPACVLTYLPPAWLTRTGYGYGQSRTANEHFVERGVIYAHVLADVSDGRGDDDAAAMMAFVNRLGGLIDDMVRQGDVPGAAYLQGAFVVVEPNRTNRVQAEMQGDFINSMLKIEWGLNAR